MRVFRLPGAVSHDPAIDTWMAELESDLGELAGEWFAVMRQCGGDVREILHDGHPTACVEDAAFGYVNAFSDHVNVGFFGGAELSDPSGMLEGNGKYMRHVKLRPARDVDGSTLRALIADAYVEMKGHLKAM